MRVHRGVNIAIEDLSVFKENLPSTALFDFLSPVDDSLSLTISILCLLCSRTRSCVKILSLNIIRKDSQQNHSVSAILVFGDSTSDPGNNNFILTPFKGNFPPYGRDFPNRIPTGRFTNGLLASDLIARYLGVKDNVPPYLDPSLTVHDLSTGVSFASAGSGYDPLTPTISNVIPLPRQLEYFREYKTRLAAKFGEKRTMEIVNNALYIVSAGTNDFVVNYFTLPIQRHKYSLPSYMEFVMNKQLDFLENQFLYGSLQEKGEQVTDFSPATFVAGEYALNDKNKFYVAPILVENLVKNADFSPEMSLGEK
ncbi:GDSL esterase/lipase [Tanacetum coccineum]